MKRVLTIAVLVVGGIACGVVIGVNIVMELLERDDNDRSHLPEERCSGYMRSRDGTDFVECDRAHDSEGRRHELGLGCHPDGSPCVRPGTDCSTRGCPPPDRAARSGVYPEHEGRQHGLSEVASGPVWRTEGHPDA